MTEVEYVYDLTADGLDPDDLDTDWIQETSITGGRSSTVFRVGCQDDAVAPDLWIALDAGATADDAGSGKIYIRSYLVGSGGDCSQVVTTTKPVEWYRHDSEAAKIQKKILLHQSQYGEDAVALAVSRVQNELQEQDSGAESGAGGDGVSDSPASLMSGDVQEVVNAVEEIRVFNGNPTVWEVDIAVDPSDIPGLEAALESDGGAWAGTLEFTESEWVQDSGDTHPPLREKLAGTAFWSPRIGWDEWQTIRDAWWSQQDIVQLEEETKEDRLARSVMSALRPRLAGNVWDSREDASRAVDHDVVGWYVEDVTDSSEYPHNKVPQSVTKSGVDGEAVVWVPSSALERILDDMDQDGAESIGNVSKALKRSGYTVASRWRTSWDGLQESLYPFKVDDLGLDEMMVQSSDNDDDDDANGDDDNGGDGADDGADAVAETPVDTADDPDGDAGEEPFTTAEAEDSDGDDEFIDRVETPDNTDSDDDDVGADSARDRSTSGVDTGEKEGTDTADDDSENDGEDIVIDVGDIGEESEEDTVASISDREADVMKPKIKRYSPVSVGALMGHLVGTLIDCDGRDSVLEKVRALADRDDDIIVDDDDDDGAEIRYVGGDRDE